MFIPPHCPNPECDLYFHVQDGPWYRQISPYETKTFGLVPRFICSHCNRSFSSQTFSIDYYAKKKMPYQAIQNQINAGSGLRNIARNFQVSPRTIRNRINRLARNAIIIHETLLHQLALNEDVVADGIESFCVSQYFPDNYHILVGKDSQFVYRWNYVTLRQKGRMRDDQKKRRAILEKHFCPPPKAVESSFGDLMAFLNRRTQERETPLILYTNEKKDYQRALWNRDDLRERLFSGTWRRHMVNSKEVRNAQIAGLDRKVLEASISGFFTERCFWRMACPLEGLGKRSLERGWITPLRKGSEQTWKHLVA